MATQQRRRSGEHIRCGARPQEVPARAEKFGGSDRAWMINASTEINWSHCLELSHSTTQFGPLPKFLRHARQSTFADSRWRSYLCQG
jgi:hypothetical protein